MSRSAPPRAAGLVTVRLHSDIGWKGLPAPRRMREWIECAVRGTRRRRAAEVHVLITGRDYAQQLNREFRGRDYATNVLSFPTEAPPGLKIDLIGDLALCAEVVAEEAAQQDKTLANHYAHLLIHGTLHLLGYDHIDDADAERMEALETRLLAQIGIADPYCAP